MLSISFDLKNAHDTTWKYRIMIDLHDMDLRGSLPLIQFFLSKRKFRIRVGSHSSLIFMTKEWKYPRVTIFIGKITRCIGNGVGKSLFADDFGVLYRTKHMQVIERQLELHLNADTA